MASPFSIFRKNQKAMLALLTLLAMFGFVFLPIILQGMGGRGTTNPVVAKTSKFGNLQVTYLTFLRQNHLKVLDVLSELRAAGAKDELDAAVAAGKLSAENAAMLSAIRYSPAANHQYYESLFGPATEENLVVRLWLLARHAEQMGMVVSDDMIRNFLKEVTFNALSSAKIQAVFDHAGVSARGFFNLMHDELAAKLLREDFEVSTYAATPGQRWDYFNRVKRIATVEAIAIPVANYVKEIADPTDEELKAFFEANKDREQLPDSPEPGFRRPHEVALEYFWADYDKFASPKLVTDAEVQQRYEKNKDVYDKFIETLSEEKSGKEKPVASTKNTKESTKESKKDESKPAKKEEPKKETKATEKKKETSAVGRASPIVLAAYLQEEKAGDKPQAASKTAEPAKKPEAPPQKKPEPPKAGLPDSLKSRIRREIAHERITKIFQGLREQMDRYGQKWSEYDVERIKNQNAAGGAQKPPTPPPGLNFEELAKESGLSAGHTGLISQRQAQGTEIGASVVERRAYAWQYAFQSLATFRPAASEDAQGLYLFWKTRDEKEHVPNFEDKGVREEVVRSWKMIAARKLALAEAKSLAEKAAQAEKPLKQIFADRPSVRVVSLPPFSWMTFGNVADPQQPPRLSAVAGVEMAGEDFMRTVFRLEPGQASAAFNAPQTVAYVVRVDGFSPSYAVRKAQFEVDDFRKYAAVSLRDRQQMYQAWLKEIQSSAGFEWVSGHKVQATAESGQPTQPDQPWED